MIRKVHVSFGSWRRAFPGPARGHRRLGQAFKGKINWIQLDLGADDHDHLITRRNDCAGMAADELGSIAWRNYLDPVSKTGTDPAEVIFDQAIKFCPSGDQAVGPAGADASVSGLDEAASTLSGSVTTEAVSPKSLTFTAFDLAGNSASQECTYNVIYDFGGYFPPVAPAPAFNLAAIGSAIPLKFSLAGDQGLDILAAGYPAAQPVDCQTRVPLGPASATRPAGKSGLSYDPLTGWYNYVWKTDRAQPGICSVLTIQLSDGTQHVAYFKFQ